MARKINLRKASSLSSIWLIAISLARLAAAQNIQFTGAVQVVNGVPNVAGSPPGGPPLPQQSTGNAVQAQCPADNPVSCTNIQQPSFCCPSDQVCSYRNSVVACCPQGQTCTGSPQGGGGAGGAQHGSFPPTSYSQPTQAPQYPGAGYAAPTTTQGYAETLLYGQESYCSTLYAKGPNLPATQAAPCGTILILPAEGVIEQALGWMRLLLVVFGLQAIGGLLLARR